MVPTWAIARAIWHEERWVLVFEAVFSHTETAAEAGGRNILSAVTWPRDPAETKSSLESSSTDCYFSILETMCKCCYFYSFSHLPTPYHENLLNIKNVIFPSRVPYNSEIDLASLLFYSRTTVYMWILECGKLRVRFCCPWGRWADGEHY